MMGMGSGTSGNRSAPDPRMEAVRKVQAHLSTFELPGQIRCSYAGATKQAGMLETHPVTDDNEFNVDVELRVAGRSGPVYARVPVPVRQGALLRPSVIFIDGQARMIAQSVFDDLRTMLTVDMSKQGQVQDKTAQEYPPGEEPPPSSEAKILPLTRGKKSSVDMSRSRNQTARMSNKTAQSESEKLEPSVMIDKGLQALATDRYEEGIEFLARAYAATRTPHILLYLGHAYEKVGNVQKAVDAYTQYAASHPVEEAKIHEKIRSLTKTAQAASADAVRWPVEGFDLVDFVETLDEDYDFGGPSSLLDSLRKPGMVPVETLKQAVREIEIREGFENRDYSRFYAPIHRALRTQNVRDDMRWLSEQGNLPGKP